MIILPADIEKISPPSCFSCKHPYFYYHYGLQETNDAGWGCGYRSLQSIIDCLKRLMEKELEIPTLKGIQEILHELGDKPETFVGSREWIGSYEVFLVINSIFDIDCKIMNIPGGKFTEENLSQICEHFAEGGVPIMMGGGKDKFSKLIVSIDFDKKNPRFLILDPHFNISDNAELTIDFLITNGWLKWHKISDLKEDKYYNLCIPQYYSCSD